MLAYTIETISAPATSFRDSWLELDDDELCRLTMHGDGEDVSRETIGPIDSPWTGYVLRDDELPAYERLRRGM